MRTTLPIRAPFAVLMALTLTVACSDDKDAADTPPTVSATSPAPTTTTDGSADSDPEHAPPEPTAPNDGADPSTTSPETTAPSMPEPDSRPPRLSGLDHIDVVTPASGGGVRPLLAWGDVDGADLYGIHLYAPDDSIYWSWQGTDTEVFVGGAAEIPDAVPGPSVSMGMSWSVVAYDIDELPIAISDVVPIEP